MDAKSLLRAKKAEAKITHPYASYNAAGVLRCSICAVPVKQWDAHLLTKQHRTYVMREKAEREKAAAAARKKEAKRPAEEGLAAASGSGGVKRAKTQSGRTSPRAGEDEGENEDGGPSNGLPAGFFSAGNRPTAASDDDEDDDQAQAGPSASTSTLGSSAVNAQTANTGDAELDDFLSSLNDDASSLNPELLTSTLGPAPTNKATPTTAAGRRKTYKEVIPGQASYEAAPVRIAPQGEEAEGGKTQQEEEAESEESEQEKRARLEREEREEIVTRLEEEERAQEDADSRVASLKARMEMIKKRREARGGGATGAGSAAKGVAKSKTKGKVLENGVGADA